MYVWQCMVGCGTGVLSCFQLQLPHSRLWKLHVRHLGHLRSFKCWHVWHLDVRNLHIWDFDLGDFDVRHLQTQSNRISTQTRTCKLI